MNKPTNRQEQYPEHAKASLIKHDSQVIGEFVEWLGEHGYSICEERKAASDIEPVIESPNQTQVERLGNAFCRVLQSIADSACVYWPTTKRLPEALLAEYFQIDLKKLEAEKVQMLEDFRAQTGQK